MRVLIVSHSAVVDIYREKFHHLVDLGVEVHLLLPPAWPEGGRRLEAPKEPAEQGVNLHVVPALGLGKVGGFCLYGLDPVVRRIDPDIIHAEEEPYSLAAWQLFNASRRLGKPFVFFTWENILRAYKWPLSWVDERVTHQSRWAIAGNQEAKDVLAQRGFLGKCRVIPQYGINPSDFKPMYQDQEDPRDFTIGYCGRLLEEKGIHTLLDAVGRLDFPYRLIITGNGPFHKRLREIVHDGGLAQVEFRPAVPNAQMPQTLQALDVLVLPSETRADWKEQFGRVLIEAMACGVPVVGSSSGEIRHVIDDAGIIFPEGQAEALAERLAHLQQHPELRKDLARRGRQRVILHFTNLRIAEQTQEFYATILAGRK